MQESFASRIGEPLRRTALKVLQINMGFKCNMACTHCHHDASPARTEQMSPEVAQKVIAWIRQYRPSVVDLTGGAPEVMNVFRDVALAARAAGCTVIDRCNLSVLSLKGLEDLPAFLANNKIQVIASMPCYLQENVDAQRGKGAYDNSIKGLKMLNDVGYGKSDDLPLNLIYNPGGAFLAPPQEALEGPYKERLLEDWGIVFTKLYCLNNFPIKRFKKSLIAKGELEQYEQLLHSSFNPESLEGVMCKSTLSVDYTGALYDCDFNLSLGLNIAGEKSRHMLWDLDPATLVGMPIAVGDHCYACCTGKKGCGCFGEH
eukprot:TRINITY_DN28791_c0_g1_i1.p1 TRINITY_DN28791_c0_g1~~TRINITY_DN28791_c0_g1_i1.p1  ORF type:complete len:316 (-),score=56.42 TRINITY_DN28791_c0_g1_i1:26-973(-)